MANEQVRAGFANFMEVMEAHANPRLPAHPWSREDPDFVYATQSGLWRPGHPIGRETTAVDSETGETVDAAYFLFHRCGRIEVVRVSRLFEHNPYRMEIVDTEHNYPRQAPLRPHSWRIEAYPHPSRFQDPDLVKPRTKSVSTQTGWPFLLPREQLDRANDNRSRTGNSLLSRQAQDLIRVMYGMELPAAGPEFQWTPPSPKQAAGWAAAAAFLAYRRSQLLASMLERAVDLLNPWTAAYRRAALAAAQAALATVVSATRAAQSAAVAADIRAAGGMPSQQVESFLSVAPPAVRARVLQSLTPRVNHTDAAYRLGWDPDQRLGYAKRRTPLDEQQMHSGLDQSQHAERPMTKFERFDSTHATHRELRGARLDTVDAQPERLPLHMSFKGPHTDHSSRSTPTAVAARRAATAAAAAAARARSARRQGTHAAQTAMAYRVRTADPFHRVHHFLARHETMIASTHAARAALHAVYVAGLARDAIAQMVRQAADRAWDLPTRRAIRDTANRIQHNRAQRIEMFGHTNLPTSRVAFERRAAALRRSHMNQWKDLHQVYQADCRRRLPITAFRRPGTHTRLVPRDLSSYLHHLPLYRRHSPCVSQLIASRTRPNTDIGRRHTVAFAARMAAAAAKAAKRHALTFSTLEVYFRADGEAYTAPFADIYQAQYAEVRSYNRHIHLAEVRIVGTAISRLLSADMTLRANAAAAAAGAAHRAWVVADAAVRIARRCEDCVNSGWYFSWHFLY